MGKFNRSDRPERDFKKRSFGRDDRGDRGGFGTRPSMHQAICSECGKTCEVPFRPTGEKPVFCNDCFRNKRDGGYRHQDSSSSRSNSGSQSFSAPAVSKEQFESLNLKLDQIIKMLSANDGQKISDAKEVSAKAAKPVKVKKTEIKAKTVKAEKAKKKK